MSDFIKINIPNIKSLSQKDTLELKKKIIYYEEKYPKCKIFIDSLCYTDKTFDNSISAILDYLEFTDFYRGLDKKERDSIKFLTSLQYDSNNDSLVTFQIYTKDYKSDLLGIKNIIYSDYNVHDLFSNGKETKEKLKSILKNNKVLNKATLVVANFYKNIIKLNESDNPINIFISGENNISLNLLSLSINYLSCNNKLCGVINEENELKKLIYDKDESNDLISFLTQIPYLFISDFDDLNLNLQFIQNGLLPILIKRKEEKKVTLIFSNCPLNESIKKLTYSSELKQKFFDVFNEDYLIFNHIPTNIFNL